MWRYIDARGEPGDPDFYLSPAGMEELCIWVKRAAKEYEEMMERVVTEQANLENLYKMIDAREATEKGKGVRLASGFLPPMHMDVATGPLRVEAADRWMQTGEKRDVGVDTGCTEEYLYCVYIASPCTKDAKVRTRPRWIGEHLPWRRRK